MRSLKNQTACIMQITCIILLFIGCHTTTTEKSIQVNDACNQEGTIKVVMQYEKTIDTLCLLPEQIISNKMVDKAELEAASRVDNYNPSFINMIHKTKYQLIEFSKGKYGYDIELKEIDKERRYAFISQLNIDEKNYGSYHVSSDPGDKPYEIQFTPEFAAMLKKMKNQK